MSPGRIVAGLAVAGLIAQAAVSLAASNATSAAPDPLRVTDTGLDGVNPFAFAERLTARPAPMVAPARHEWFPIAGKHDLGRTATNGFGGPRHHRGQDMFAACGTPLVAVRDAKVQHTAYEG